MKSIEYVSLQVSSQRAPKMQILTMCITRVDTAQQSIPECLSIAQIAQKDQSMYWASLCRSM